MKRLALALAALLVGWAGTSPSRAATVNIPAGNLTGINVWTADNEYVLQGFVYVLSGAQLIIEPGTVIRGVEGTGSTDFGNLFVCRGARIFAEGTPTKPIIFTAEVDDLSDPADLTPDDTQLWGGLIIMGRARINNAVSVAGDGASPKYDVYEGLPDIESASGSGEYVHRFGGADDDDNSGVLRYVSIRHGGKLLESNKEVNGLSLCGVGRGTVIENVEVFANSDDGFEFFGGTVNTKYLVSAFVEDELFDTDQGYSGKNQFWFGIHKADSREKGSEQNGEPNDRVTGTAVPVATYEIYNATLIGAGKQAVASGNDAMTLRQYLQCRWYNSVITEFNGRPINGGTFQSGAMPELKDNLWWSFTQETLEPAELFASENHNDNVDPMLRGISREADGGLDPRPAAASPALSSVRTAPVDGFYTPVAYKGAFDASDLWLATWTFLAQGGFLPARGANLVQVPAGNLTGTNVWTSDNQYLLEGFVYLVDGAELHIEPGTVIKAVEGTGNTDFGNLFICRGGKIFAEGTPHNPIIFTSEFDDLSDPEDLTSEDTQLWGGVILMGRARINNAVSVAGDGTSPKYDVYEGLPDNESAPGSGEYVHRYGGGDDEDSSGVLRYVSIRHGGKLLESNKEVNGLSLCGVGRGTVIENVEVFANSDDGFEFFGGTVNTKYLVSAFVEDELFDTDQGYSGKNQFWFGIHKADSREKGSEQNGEPNDRVTGTAVPVATYEIYNATLIGAGKQAVASGNDAMTLRQYLQCKWYNSVITEFNGRPINGGAFQSGSMPELKDNLWWSFTQESLEPAEMFAPENHNDNLDPMLRGISRTADGGLDPRPASGSPAWSSARTAPADGFYTPVAYKGAFAEVNWAADWTALAETGFLTARGGGNPVMPPPAAMPELVLSANIQDGQWVLSWTGGGDGPFTVQRKPTLSDSAWTDVTTVSERRIVVPVEGDTGFFRIAQ